MNNIMISMTWGKACNYLPASVEPICWDGTAKVENGSVCHADLLHYKYVAWCQGGEESECIFTASADASNDTVSWKSAVEVGGPLSLEGLRLCVCGDENTAITLTFAEAVVKFRLGDLMREENLRYHVGSKYGGMPVDIFLGPDARPRLSKKQYDAILKKEQRAGCLLVPDDFAENQKAYYHSLYGVRLEMGESATACFDVAGRENAVEEICLVKLQILGMLGYETQNEMLVERVAIELKLAEKRYTAECFVGNRCLMPALLDVYVEIPWSDLDEADNTMTVSYLDGDYPLLLHRVAIGAQRPSHAAALQKMPALPKERKLHVGAENNMQIPQNGEVDAIIRQMEREELGDYLGLRGRVAQAPEEDRIRWAKMLKERGFLAATSSSGDVKQDVIEEILGDHYWGEQAHEISNLAYGWGDPDPIEERIHRDLPGCKAAFLKRMGPHRMVGQALPMQYLDYEAGVQTIMTEVPASHATLVLHAARGAARTFDKTWGVHVANHVTRTPLDGDHVRRLFILVNQIWLHGAVVIQDEEVALRYDHDTPYAFSDPFPTAYREIYQSIYHYGNAIDLGTPVINTGFLQGNYDFPIGGLQAAPWVERTKFWGMFGPETEAWEFNTPESGWKLIDSYMPGTWLYPVLQDRTKIRLFFGGSPNGQVDLLPATASPEKLSAYQTLILPGWNTMTEEIYQNLCDYVRQGGFLVLCAAQCTEHTTRDFLLEKKEFNFCHGGDLSQLAGVKVKMSDHVIKAICFEDETVAADPGIVRLDTELCGGKAIATDLCGNPVLVEHAIGKGCVWMLCVGEYWGAEALDEFREVLCKRIDAQTKQTVRLSGETAEVDCYEFKKGDLTQIFLLNTDWTSSGNVKQITVHTGDLDVPVAVKEGSLKQILYKDGTAVLFDVPASIVLDFSVKDDAVTFSLQGVGIVTVELFRSGHTKKLQKDLGDHWRTEDITIKM